MNCRNTILSAFGFFLIAAAIPQAQAYCAISNSCANATDGYVTYKYPTPQLLREFLSNSRFPLYLFYQTITLGGVQIPTNPLYSANVRWKVRMPLTGTTGVSTRTLKQYGLSANTSSSPPASPPPTSPGTPGENVTITQPNVTAGGQSYTVSTSYTYYSSAGWVEVSFSAVLNSVPSSPPHGGTHLK